MRQSIILALIVSMVVLGAGFTWAGPGKGDCGNCDGPKCGNETRMADTLGLSDTQRDEVKAIREAERTKLKPLRDELSISREAIHEAMENDNFDEVKVRQLVREHADKKVDLQIAGREFRAKIEAVMTPEQIAKMEATRKSRQERHGKRGGNGGGKHAGPHY